MDPFVTGSLITAGASALNGIIGGIGQAQTNATSMELAKYQHDLNMQAWREQSEYNNPTNTMKRLTDAGINPRAYQQLGQFANASTPPQASVPHYESPLQKFSQAIPSVSALVDIFTKLRLSEAEEKNINAQTNKLENDAALSWVRSLFLTTQEMNEKEKHQLWRFMNGATFDKDGTLTFGKGLENYNSEHARLTLEGMTKDNTIKQNIIDREPFVTRELQAQIIKLGLESGMLQRDLEDFFDSATGNAVVRFFMQGLRAFGGR